jgi:diguanylate cyclase (GGDEF)-like protein
MTRIFDKDYKYLLTNLIPHHRLTPERRRELAAAVAVGERTRMRSAAILALDDLCDRGYFDQVRLTDEDQQVVVTYVKKNGSYQIRLTVPPEEWDAIFGDSRPGYTAARGAYGSEPPGRTTGVRAAPVETTINILPDIIRSLSIDGQRESTFERLDSVLKFMPRWFRFTSCRLVLVEERLTSREGRGEVVETQREKAFQEKVIYQRCRHTRQTAVLDPAGARAVGVAKPDGESGGVPGDARLAVSPVFAHEDFWGVLEVWSVGEDDGPLFRDRVEIASGIIEQIIENSVRLENLTSIDKLTGVYNRQFYDRLVRIEIERARRSGSKLSLLVLDIDDFKTINDSMGHRKGDEALVVVADLMRSHLRKIDIPFRYGGEEFTILLPGTAESEAIRTAERLRAMIAEYDEFVDHDGKQRAMTVSIGAAVFPDQARTEEELFSRADEALYLAKRNGKNRVELYHQ